MISVVIGIFGDDSWDQMADNAAQSAICQCDDVIVHRSDTLAAARNRGAELTNGDWLCFLDADDELGSGFISAMEECIATLSDNKYLLQPSTIGFSDKGEDPEPFLIPSRNLIDGNYMIVGTLINKSIFKQVGGFSEWPIYEDWDLWLRAVYQAGCKVNPVADAIYRVRQSNVGRNSQDAKIQGETYRAIRSQYASILRR